MNIGLSPSGQLLGFELLWSMTRGDPRVVIAVLDGPVDIEHACLSGAHLEFVGLSSTRVSGGAASWRHGTHVTSQIFADHNCGFSGIAPKCRGLLIPVFDGTADGGLTAASQVDLARSIHLAVDRGANIINISGGQPSATSEADQFLADALAYCDKAGVLVVAAAGNNGCECLHVPASIASVLAVGAFDPATGKPLSFSNWGQAYRSNGILAPGKDMPGAQAGGGLTYRTGTSFAAPIVTGAAALLMSVQLKRGMAVDARAVRETLLRGASRCDDSVAEDCRPYLAGKLDVNASLGLLGSESNVVEPSQTAAVLYSHGQETRPAVYDMSRGGVVAAETPDVAELVEAESLLKSCETADACLTEVGAMKPQSAPLPSSGHLAEQAAATPGLRFVGAKATSIILPSRSRDRNAENMQRRGEDMLNTQIVTGGDQQSAEVVEPGTPIGIEPSDIPAQAGTAAVLASGVKHSGGCGCESCAGAERPQLVFALGELGYDLVTEARKDSLWQAMNGDPHEWSNLARHLDANPWDAEAVTWTLRIDATPIYAIRPMGAYAPDAYRRLASYLIGQIGNTGKDKRKFERVSLPGWIAGSVTLSNGITVPVVMPSLRGMFAWDTRSLVEALKLKAEEEIQVTNFLERLYYDLRNLGLSPQDRAKNFAATNAYQVGEVFRNAVRRKLVLDHIEVQKSPICRQDSDCWDVLLTFFDPANDRAARDVHRFTVDVSDVVPCTVGRVRNWFIR